MPGILDSASVVIGAPTLGYQLINLNGEVLSILTMEGARELLRDDPGLRKRSYQVSFPKEPRDTDLELLLERRFSASDVAMTFGDHVPDITQVLSPLDQAKCPHCQGDLEAVSSERLYFQQFVALLKARGLLNRDFWEIFKKARPKCLQDKHYAGGVVDVGILTVEAQFKDLW